MKITQEVRAFAMEQASRRCECTGSNCRHHRSGARCKKGLRGDEWKVYWRSEDAGATRDNIEAWCLQCFANNFEVPSEIVALLATDIAGYARLLEEDSRRAVTLKSVLRDAAERAAGACRGRMVLDRSDDDVLVEFPACKDAITAARSLRSGFEEIASRLDLPAPPLHGAIHYGQVTRWRNGLLVGEAVDVTTSVRGLAGVGEILLTDSAVEPVRGKLDFDPVPIETGPIEGDSPVEQMWMLRL